MRFFRVATSGATIDGREIGAKDLQQAAANYDPDKYAARIWLEHYRSITPEGPFSALGDVLELKTEENEDGQTVLLARIEAGDELKAINKKSQKLYTSIELQPNFANTGEAYCVGLAVTDSPASIGTERLMFSAKQQNQAHTFSDYAEADLDVTAEPEAKNPESKGILFRVKQMLSKNTEAQTKDASAAFAAFHEDVNESFEQVINEFTAKDKAQAEALNSLRSDFNALKEQLDTTPDTNNYSNRPPADGSSAFKSDETDC